jgi:hypothetical protein
MYNGLHNAMPKLVHGIEQMNADPLAQSPWPHAHQKREMNGRANISPHRKSSASSVNHVTLK